MSDLTKLTAKQFQNRISGWCQVEPDEWGELGRRLERLEKCEQSLARFQSDKSELGDLSFREQLRSELITGTLKENETLKDRLEKCKADYQALWKKLRKTEVLAEYADHFVPCPRTHGDGTKCTCGYEAARVAVEE